MLSRAAWVMEARGGTRAADGSALYRDTLWPPLPLPPSLSRASWVLGGHTGAALEAPGVQAGRVQTGGYSLVRRLSPGV